MQDYEMYGNLLQFDKLWKLLAELCFAKEVDFFAITFGDLYKQTQRFLTITGTCLSKGICEEFNAKTNPNMLIHTALQITT